MMTSKMKRWMGKAALLTLCSAGIGTVALYAQDAPPAPPAGQTDQQGPPMGGQGGPGGPGRGMGGERMVQMMTKQLNLTPDQVTKLKAIDADDTQQMMALRDNTSMAQADKRTKMMALRQDHEGKIKAMLTDDQKTKYEEMQARMRERRMEHQHQGTGDAPAPPPSTSPQL